jgi:hypothetical protein
VNKEVPTRNSPRPAADGERNALGGFLPQYLVGAEKVLRELSAGALDSVVLGDADAGRLDDFQLVSERDDGLWLHAYQVKWSANREVIGNAEFRGLIADAVEGLGKIRKAREGKRSEVAAPITAYRAHIYSNRPPSEAGLRGKFAGCGLSVARFLVEVWNPAGRGDLSTIDEVPKRWQGYLNDLAEQCGLETIALLKAADEIVVELGQALPEDKALQDREGARFLRDVKEIAAGMKRLVIDPDRPSALPVLAFLQALGPEWAGRGRRRSEHEFPLPRGLKPIEGAIERLREAIDSNGGGYVFLFGSPGSGKSTLLTHVLRLDARLAARYYAFVPGKDTRTRGEASAFLHDLLFALSGGRALLPPESDGALMRERLRDALRKLGEQARTHDTVSIVLIDGLDHVLRDPEPRDPFLAELPAPDEIPEGVLIVLGTRGRADLPTHVVSAATAERVVETEPLSRPAVLELAGDAGVAEQGQRIFELSEGHPLLTQTYVSLIRELPAADRSAALSALQPLQGEVMTYYEKVWGDVKQDDDLIDALAVACRLRTAIDLNWLEWTGTPRAAIRSLERLRYLFRVLSGGRWTFFHDSFREFLRRRTAERDGAVDQQRERTIQRELANRCEKTDPDRPESWESVHHLIAAGLCEEALALATPERFRRQYEALRPVGEVRASIQEAAGALGDHHDALALLRLALSAAEAEAREYAYPEGGKLGEALVELGNPELAMAHVGRIDDVVMDNDRTRSAMELVVSLADAGYHADAERFFEFHEPLRWLGGGGEVRPSAGGPWQALYAWADAALEVRGVDHVLAGIERLDLGEEDRPWRGRENRDEQMRSFKMELLGNTATTALLRGRRADYDRLFGSIDSNEPGGANQIAECLFAELANLDKESDERLDLFSQLEGIADRLSAGRRLRLASFLSGYDGGEEALRVLATLPAPSVPDPESLDRNGSGWGYLYRYYRLRAMVGYHDDPVAAMPMRKGREHEVFVARHAIHQAQLDGRVAAGEKISATELLRVVRGFHNYLTGVARSDSFRGYGVGGVRRRLAHTAIGIAERLGAPAIRELWGYWQERWRADESEFLRDGIDLLDVFARAGVGEVTIRAELRALEGAMAGPSDLEAGEWVLLGRAWQQAGESGHARECLGHAVAMSNGVGFRKDHQLTEWLRLLRPLLTGPDAEPAGHWLSTAIIALHDRIEASAPWEAARLLVKTLAEANPVLALACARPLLDAKVLDLDEVLDEVLEGTASQATQLWWALLSETLVGVGAGPPHDSIGVAASIAEDHAAGLARLREVAERVSVEGRPSERIGWREELRKAAEQLGVGAAELGLGTGDFEPGNETPPADGSYSSSTEDEDEKQAAAASPTDLLDALERSPGDYSTASAVIARMDELDSKQLLRVEAILRGGEREARFAAALAERAKRDGDVDEAWARAEHCLAVADGRDWQRQWAGGPVLDALRILASIDMERARVLAFKRFSAVASTDRFLLNEVARSFETYDEAFGPLDEGLAAECAWGYVASLLSRDATEPPPELERPFSGSAQTVEGAVDEALGAIVLELFRSPYSLARDCGQRTLMAIADDRRAFKELSLSALSEDSIDPALVLAVIASLVPDALDPDAEIRARLRELALDRRLDLRLPAREILEGVWEEPPSSGFKPLPPAYELALQTPVDRTPEEELGIGEGDLEEMIRLFRHELGRLAELVGLDIKILHERVAMLAMRDDLGQGDDHLHGRGPFGWGFIRPSVWRVRRALAEICTELFEARRVDPLSALYSTRLAPVYDIGLLRSRPQRRPSAVGPMLNFEERESYYSDWFLKEDPGVERIAEGWNGWRVVGESTELTLIGRQYPEEHRQAGLFVGELDGEEVFRKILRYTSEEFADGSPKVENSLIVERRMPSNTSPDWWLGLHSEAAKEIGLAPDPESPLSWKLDGEVVARSLWWRSGYLRWSARSPKDEVGEGWLVLARPKVLEMLESTFGTAQRAWRITTSMRDESSGEKSERVISGVIR